MWRGYGANGDGVAVVIDMAKINVSEKSPSLSLRYHTIRQRLDWTGFGRSFQRLRHCWQLRIFRMINSTSRRMYYLKE